MGTYLHELDFTFLLQNENKLALSAFLHYNFFHFSQVELQLLLENLPEEMCLSLRIEEAISIILWPLFHPPPKVGEVKVILKVNKYMTFTPSAVLCLL